jgi:hypothetical protein
MLRPLPPRTQALGQFAAAVGGRTHPGGCPFTTACAAARSRRSAASSVNHSSTVPQYVPGSVQRRAVKSPTGWNTPQSASDGVGCSQKGILRVLAGSDVTPCKDINRRDSDRLGRHPDPEPCRQSENSRRRRNYDFGYVLASGNTMASSLDVGRDMPLQKIGSQRLENSTKPSAFPGAQQDTNGGRSYDGAPEGKAMTEPPSWPASPGSVHP